MKFAIFAASLVAIAVSPATAAQAAGAHPSAPVEVTNTAANPVPIQAPGGVTVSGGVAIVNTSPIPVTVVPPPAAQDVICRTGSVADSSGTWPYTDGAFPVVCPPGVVALDIHRVIVDPQAGATVSNLANASTDYLVYQELVWIAPRLSATSDPADVQYATAILGMFTQSRLEKELSRPTRINLQSDWIG
ncbi:MAG: hypothetical protein ACM3QY_11265, partial [Candidatus Levyibacteriota bacterium]